MKTTKSLLLASAAVAVVAMTPSSAKAFDDVDWSWVVNATKTITENITITDTFDLSGLATIEASQINIGNVTATATLQDFENNPPVVGDGDGDGLIDIDETFIFGTVDYNDEEPDFSIVNPGPVDSEDNGLPTLQAELTGGDVNEQLDEIADLEVHVTGEVPVAALEEAVNVAYDLPKVENIATAVANNFSLDSTVGVNLHEGQYNWGGFNPITLTDTTIPTGPEQGYYSIDGDLAELALAYFGSDVTDNPFADAAVFGVLAGALGTITQGEVEATATVDGNFPGDISVQNASVENAATAVGNNISVGIEATLAGDGYMVADLTQFNYANTTATATVDNVHIDNYTGFGDAGMGPCGGCISEGLENVGAQIPVVSNIATAVGNNISLSINNAGTVVEVPETPTP